MALERQKMDLEFAYRCASCERLIHEKSILNHRGECKCVDWHRVELHSLPDPVVVRFVEPSPVRLKRVEVERALLPYPD